MCVCVCARARAFLLSQSLFLFLPFSDSISFCLSTSRRKYRRVQTCLNEEEFWKSNVFTWCVWYVCVASGLDTCGSVMRNGYFYFVVSATMCTKRYIYKTQKRVSFLFLDFKWHEREGCREKRRTETRVIAFVEGSAMKYTCNTLQHAAPRCNALRCVCLCACLHVREMKKGHSCYCTCGGLHAATRCNTLQHAATRCNTLQHTEVCVSSGMSLRERKKERTLVLLHLWRAARELGNVPFLCKNKKSFRNGSRARAGWPECRTLVRATPRAEVDVIGVQ